MKFQSRKIRKHLSKSQPAEKKPIISPSTSGKSKMSPTIFIGITVFAILLLIFAIYKTISSIDFKPFLSIAGEELEKDAFGHTNFLILGKGGENHDGGDLSDTIIVASLDDENKLITMLSIPRDLWIRDELIGSHKINEFYFYAERYFGDDGEALEYTKSKIEEIVGAPLHYWAQIDFKGFTELIDALGGIDVIVQEDIYDPYYPLDGTYQYQTFSIKAGPQQLDGATALKYARSRKTTSDFDRARRQQDVIYAVKEKALQTEILFDGDKIAELLNTLKANIQTNINVKEVLTLGSIASDYNQSQITHRLIHDDQYSCGGILYTPVRELYGGLFVLVPAGGLESIHRYTDLNFNHPKVAHTDTNIHILNGTARAYAATETKQILQRLCFNVPGFGNALTKEVATTTYYYQERKDAEGNIISERPIALDYLTTIIPGTVSTEIPPEYREYFVESDIVLELGANYTDTELFIEDNFYSLPIYTGPTATDDEEEDEEESEQSSDEGSLNAGSEETSESDTPPTETETPPAETTPEPADNATE